MIFILMLLFKYLVYKVLRLVFGKHPIVVSDSSAAVTLYLRETDAHILPEKAYRYLHILVQNRRVCQVTNLHITVSLLL